MELLKKYGYNVGDLKGVLVKFIEIHNNTT